MPFDFRFSDVSSRGLRLFVRPASNNRTRAWTTILLLVAAVCVADYLVGIDFSLALFYLVPVSLAAGWLGARPGIAIAIVSTGARLLGDMLDVYPAPLPAHIWWNVGAGQIILLMVVWLVSTLVGAYHALEGRIAARTSELAASIADRRRLEIEVLDVSARERATIGRELHDELGQHLVATALAAQVLAHKLGDRGGTEAQSIVSWIEQAIAKTRKLARGLLLAHIDADRLGGELEELAKASQKAGVACSLSQQSGKVHASPSQCAQLFRIAQEAVGNALRHGQARTIDITLAADEQATCLVVTDDGFGFDTRAPTTGMGLQIMQHRAQIIGASLTIFSLPRGGTKVLCRLPTQPASP